jgi:hypothetical protein
LEEVSQIKGGVAYDFLIKTYDWVFSFFAHDSMVALEFVSIIDCENVDVLVFLLNVELLLRVLAHEDSGNHKFSLFLF